MKFSISCNEEGEKMRGNFRRIWSGIRRKTRNREKRLETKNPAIKKTMHIKNRKGNSNFFALDFQFPFTVFSFIWILEKLTSSCKWNYQAASFFLRQESQGCFYLMEGPYVTNFRVVYCVLVCVRQLNSQLQSSSNTIYYSVV